MDPKKYLSFDGLMAIPVAARVEKDFEIPGWGVVRIRALSTDEYWRGQQAAKEQGVFDHERWQAYVISTAMVDPRMSYDDAIRFGRERPYGVVTRLANAIVDLTMGVPGRVSEEVIAAAEASFRG